jgi:putative hydrolase of the HAD superfamily
MDHAEVLLFDFWGVIGVVQSPDEVHAMARIIGVPNEVFVAAYWSERHLYDAGAAAADYWGRVARRVGAELTSDLLMALVECDTGSWRRVDPFMVELLDELARAGRRMALLSNIPRDLTGFVRGGAAAPYMEHMIFSCEVGFAKPDPEIYEIALRRLDVPASNVLFIDDRANNVEAASAIGLRGLVHTSVAETRAALLGRSDLP